MALIKLLYSQFEINNINSEGFYISKKTQTIRDLNKNEIIFIPFLIDDNLYKIELAIADLTLYVYVYINYNILKYLVIKNKIIPCRNDLFKLLIKNANYFKFNKFNFNSKLLNLITSIENNIYDDNTIIRALDNKLISYKDICFDLDNEIININNTCRSLIRINTYLLYMFNRNLKQFINNLKSKNLLVIYDKNYDFDYDFDINIKSYKKLKIYKLLKKKVITLDFNLIKKKNYFRMYKDFHSKNNYNLAFNNIKRYISNCTENIDFFNVELLDFDYVIFLNVFKNNLTKNKNFNLFVNLIESKNKIFIEDIYNNTFNYEVYKSYRKFAIKNDNLVLDINVNNHLMNNKIFIENVYSKVYIKNIFTRYELGKFSNQYGNVNIYEEVLEKNKIRFRYSSNQNLFLKNSICPISYENLNENVYVETDCNHHYLLDEFIKFLNYDSFCPICKRNLKYSDISIIGKKYFFFRNNFLIEILNNFHNKKLKIAIVKKAHVNLLTYRYKFMDINNIIFTDLENLYNVCLNHIGECIEIYEFTSCNNNILYNTKFNDIINRIYKIKDNISINKIK